MLAPIDAQASVEADGETIRLQLNFRTLALAKAAGVNMFTAALSDLDPIDMAKVVRCFATPDRPDFTDEQAFALLIRHSEAVDRALTALASEFAGVAEEGDGASRPPKRAQRKRSAS